ncbi:hypothetical protein F4803DRAFT_525398 [Xylaria telfairii]|nr:hypothetical protein F4803DRAFT_525398 [Xylaria telfairii]
MLRAAFLSYLSYLSACIPILSLIRFGRGHGTHRPRRKRELGNISIGGKEEKGGKMDGPFYHHPSIHPIDHQSSRI